MMGDASRPSCQIVTTTKASDERLGERSVRGFRALVGRGWREPAGDMDMKRCMLQLKFKKSLQIPCGAWHLAPFLVPFVVVFFLGCVTALQLQTINEFGSTGNSK